MDETSEEKLRVIRRLEGYKHLLEIGSNEIDDEDKDHLLYAIQCLG